MKGMKKKEVSNEMWDSWCMKCGNEMLWRIQGDYIEYYCGCLLYTSPSPRDISGSRMPSSA